MTVAAVTPLSLVMDTASADFADADATAITTGADGFSIDADSVDWTGRKMVIKFVDDGSGDVITILAGDYPPALRQGLGNLVITLAASDVKYVVLESARFLQNDGKILGTSTGTGVKVGAIVLPRGA